jgi:solute carrier family 25 carnitine/acylcarnitine transporter 20/29
MVGKGDSTMELLYGSISGMAFGLISPIAGQPFDTIKTKMQAETRFASSGSWSVASSIVKADGFTGLYRGLTPILASTGVQKSVLFAANSSARRAVENSGVDMLTTPIPLTAGLKPGVIVGGVAAAAARTVVETPFELMKVRRQTGASWRIAEGGGAGGGVVGGGGVGETFSLSQVKEFYTGAWSTFSRAAIMLGTFFVLCDYSERLVPDLVAMPLTGGFFKGGCCATVAWGVAWPFEVVKSKVQGAEGAQYRGKSQLSIIRGIMAQNGVRGLYRGFLPGAMRSFVSNGAGMAVYQFTQSMRAD